MNPKQYREIAKILFFKNPDVIISVIDERDIEIPLMIIEFSTAVFTKDHELQRSDNFLVALISKAIFVKISPVNKTSVDHGGDTNYDYIQPFALLYNKHKLLSFHINWEVDKKFSNILEKDEKYKSFPKRYNSLSELIKIVFESYMESSQKWRKKLEEKVNNSVNFKEWIEKLKNSKIENIEDLQSSRTFYSDGNFTLKINRMGHAMDPERGMLIYYSLFFRDKCKKIISKFIFSPYTKTWYNGVSSEQEITEKIEEIKHRNPMFFNEKELLEFIFYGLSLPGTFDEFSKNIELLIKNNLNIKEIDITEYIQKYHRYFNTSFRTLITCSDMIEIEDGEKSYVTIKWNPHIADISFSIFNQLPNKSIITLRETLDEDDITFLTIHSFFKENNITTLAVSYPGAQSDIAILPERGTGRQQKRIYIDAIGLKEKSLIFQENKGKFSKKEINSDIEKLKKFKIEKAYISSVKDFKEKYHIEADKLYLGVGFPSTNPEKILIKIKINDVDYFFVVDNKKKIWKVFSSIENDHEIFEKKSGNFDLIKTYIVEENK